MKLLLTFASLLALSTSLMAHPEEVHPRKNCHCVDCKCTPEAHCGCFSENGCHCSNGECHIERR